MELKIFFEKRIHDTLSHTRAIELLLKKERDDLSAFGGELIGRLKAGGEATVADAERLEYGNTKIRLYTYDADRSAHNAYLLYGLATELKIDLALSDVDQDAVNVLMESGTYGYEFKKGKDGVMEPTMAGLWEMVSQKSKQVAAGTDLGLLKSNLLKQYESFEAQKKLYEMQREKAAEKAVNPVQEDNEKN
jgi:hypothetical protein